MKQLFANQIIEQGGIVQGLVILDRTAHENLPIIFTGNALSYIKSLIERPPADGFYTLDRFCQYIILTQYHPETRLSMKISDYNNNINVALDEYSELISKEWEKEDRDKIMRLFQIIEMDLDNRAEIIIKDSFH